MVDLVEQYNPEAEANTFETLPDGTYEAQIIESDKVPISKDKDLGDCLSLCWKVTAGELEGRLFWQRLNLWWTGPEKTPGQVVKIANAQFADVRKATGVAIPNDSAELHGIRCMVTYGKQKNDPNFSEVKSVKALGSAPDKQTAAPRAANQSAPARQPAAEAKRTPWARPAA